MDQYHQLDETLPSLSTVQRSANQTIEKCLVDPIEMVYRGKPSESCFGCQNRRIKCDKDKSGCSQCKRMRMKCPGYPDPWEQTFRDESVKVERKAQQSYRKKASKCKDTRDGVHRSAIPSMSSELSTSFSLDLDDTRTSPSQWRLVPSIEDVALAHFMSSYIPGSRFGYLPNMYAKLGRDVSLLAAIDAASKARLAWEFGEPMEAARTSYAKALTQTNAALADPVTALQDATLVSVLLLSLYETMIWAGTGVPDNWVTHTQGALTLVRLRGKPQLETDFGRQLFTHVTNIISVTSLRMRRKIPQDVVELQTEATRHEDEKHPLYLVTRYTGDLANLIADIAGGNMPVNDIVESTRRMDGTYLAFLENIPPTWGYRTTVLNEDDPDVYGRLIHEYPRPRMAIVWNTVRMTRMFLNGVIYGHASLSTISSAATIRAQAQRNVERMAADICASVWYFLNAKTFSAACAATLLWPLSEVRDSDLVPIDLRNYAVETLKRLARRLRMPGPLQDGLHVFYLT
ncbi:hypothetical protein PMIN07_003498 [Paraphaeosphaeria minitans]